MLFIYCFVNCNYMLIVYVVLSMQLKSHTIRCCHDVFGDPKQINHRRRGLATAGRMCAPTTPDVLTPTNARSFSLRLALT
jgi:hypothetical protein